MRPLVEASVRRRVMVTMTALAVSAFGLVGYSRLPLELFPDIGYPSITVQTTFPDTAPQEVETLVTRPVEEAVGVLRGLQRIHSVSRPGVSEVTLEFDWGSDMNLLSMEVREKLDRLILPQETEDPVVLRFDPSLDPIQRVALWGDGDLRAMRHLAELRIKQDLETIQGVAAAQVKGGLEEEIQIDVDQERLAALGIPLARVEAVVGVSNINRPAGKLEGLDSQYLIRTVNEYEDVEEIAELILFESSGRKVRLGEVAAVKRGAKEREEITRVDGKESVEISIYREGGANTVLVAAEVRKRLEAWKDKLPQGLQLTPLFDQSGFIRQAIDGVRDAALVGGLLAILVLFAFLRDVRSTVIVATSIPLSVIATFMVMYRAEISLNIMSLGGLTLGIGMLVDNSIVVLEAIFRRRAEGAGLARAAVDGTTEVGPAVVASTLTTVAVFVPIVFVEGIAGQLFRDQALTVTISLLASLAAAVTVIPMLAALGSDALPGTDGTQVVPQVVPQGAGRMPTTDDTEVVPPLSAPAGVKAVQTLGRFSAAYDRLLRGAIRWRWLTVGIAVLLFAAACAGVSRLGTELIPTLSEGEFLFEVNLPEGASLFATDRIVQDMEREALSAPGVGRIYSTVGSRLVAGGMSLNTKQENLGQLNVVMADPTDRAAESAAAERLREAFASVPDLEVKFGRPSYFTLRTPVEVVIFGEDLEDLRAAADDVALAIHEVPGLVDVRSSLEAGSPELQVVFDRERLAALGLDMGVVAQTLRSRVQGAVPTRLQEKDRQIDIRVRNREEARATQADIRNLVIPGPGGASLRLLTVADVTPARGPAEVHRIQQQRAAVITANVKGRSLGAAIRDVEAVIAGARLPDGMSIELGGQNREMQESFASLRFAIGLAIFLVYLVMASIFESFIHPLIVLGTIPLSLVGVVAGLLLSSTSISVIVLIGAILLVGIVVNNAIVLIDGINRFRREGMEKREAVVLAGHKRLRPILMTTLTTVLGLIPMALSWGEGAELRAPLAITVASGLLASTLLTLVVIPAVYSIVPSGVRADPLADGAGAGAVGGAS